MRNTNAAHLQDRRIFDRKQKIRVLDTSTQLNHPKRLESLNFSNLQQIVVNEDDDDG